MCPLLPPCLKDTGFCAAGGRWRWLCPHPKPKAGGLGRSFASSLCKSWCLPNARQTLCISYTLCLRWSLPVRQGRLPLRAVGDGGGGERSEGPRQQDWLFLWSVEPLFVGFGVNAGSSLKAQEHLGKGAVDGQRARGPLLSSSCPLSPPMGVCRVMKLQDRKPWWPRGGCGWVQDGGGGVGPAHSSLPCCVFLKAVVCT